MVLFLTGCAGKDQDVESTQYLSGWYCLMCAGIDAQNTIDAQQTVEEIDPPELNKPEKKE